MITLSEDEWRQLHDILSTYVCAGEHGALSAFEAQRPLRQNTEFAQELFSKVYAPGETGNQTPHKASCSMKTEQEIKDEKEAADRALAAGNEILKWLVKANVYKRAVLTVHLNGRITFTRGNRGDIIPAPQPKQ